MSALKTVKLSRSDSIKIYEQSIVGFGTNMWFARPPEKKDIEFIKAVYKAGRQYQAGIIERRYKDLINLIRRPVDN